MAAVGLVALTLAAYRANPALGWFVGTILVLATLRTWQSLDRLPAKSAWGVLRAYLGSILVAAAIVVLALLPWPVHHAGSTHHAERDTHALPEFGPSAVVGLVLSGLVAIPITIGLRRTLWAPQSPASSDDSHPGNGGTPPAR